MSKLVFDLDGVIITYEKNFAETYAAEFNLDVAMIYKFFSEDYRDCAIGRSNLADEIARYLPAWKWPGDSASLIAYWFDCQSQINVKLIELIEESKSAGHTCYIASDQDFIRSQYICALFDVDSLFDACFFSCDLGVTKTDPLFFRHVLSRLGDRATDVYFWDDNPDNVATAQRLGINAELFVTYEAFEPSFSERFRPLR